jgi:hypothetical protein
MRNVHNNGHNTQILRPPDFERVVIIDYIIRLRRSYTYTSTSSISCTTWNPVE